jgi:hypothetical protein
MQDELWHDDARTQTLGGQRSPGWRKFRVGKLSGSFVKAVKALTPTRLALVAQMFALSRLLPTPAMQRGILFERPLLEWWKENNMKSFKEPNLAWWPAVPVLFHPEIALLVGVPWMIFSPDGVLVSDSMLVLIELKTTSNDNYRAPEMKDFKEQIQYGMLVGGYHAAILLIYKLLPGEEPRPPFDSSRLRSHVYTRDEKYNEWTGDFTQKAYEFYSEYLWWFHEPEKAGANEKMSEIVTQLDERRLIEGVDIDYAFAEDDDLRAARRGGVRGAEGVRGQHGRGKGKGGRGAGRGRGNRGKGGWGKGGKGANGHKGGKERGH